MVPSCAEEGEDYDGGVWLVKKSTVAKLMMAFATNVLVPPPVG